MKFSTVKLVAIASITVLLAVIACWPETIPVVGPPGLAWTADAAGAADVEARALRACAKLLLAHDVLAGRRTLWESAALFGALNRQPPAPESVGEILASVPAAEQLCFEVIGWVANVLQQQQAKREAAIAELEAQLNQARNQPGGVRLSEPSAELVGEILTHAHNQLGLWRTP